MLRRYRSRRLNSALAEVKQSSDRTRISRLRAEVREAYRKEPYSAAKYAEFDSWLARNFLRAARLGLHETSSLRMLDIGAGPGYFIAAARALGHQCEGIDVTDDFFTPIEKRVYSELLEAMNCRSSVKPFVVKRFVPLPFPDNHFDVITSFLVCFNRHRKSDQWGVPEWRCFLDDALRVMRPDGRLFLGLNDNPERFGKLLYYDEPLLSLFESYGSVEGASIRVSKPAASERARVQSA